MLVKVYEYKKCSTCQKALRFLDEKKIKYQCIAIIEQPPSLAELRQMLGFIKADGGDFKKLFNTSGELYREMKISEKIKAGITEKEALALLAQHGKMIKRPFLLARNSGTVGFKAETWSQILQVSS